MKYSIEQIQELNDYRSSLKGKHRALLSKIFDLSCSLKVDAASEFLMQGAGRRLKIITRCIENIFDIFPVDREDKLSGDELSDIAIYIHSYFVNIAGLFDNLGWVFVYENDLYGKPSDNKINRHGVGLFSEKTQARLKPELMNYLTETRIASWHENYSKGYRDALAHRIPLYVPPAILNDEEADTYRCIDQDIGKLDFSKPEDIDRWRELMESQKALGSISMFFAHSASENDPALLHAQLVCDYLTVEEVVEKFCTHF